VSLSAFLRSASVTDRLGFHREIFWESPSFHKEMYAEVGGCQCHNFRSSVTPALIIPTATQDRQPWVTVHSVSSPRGRGTVYRYLFTLHLHRSPSTDSWRRTYI